MLTVLGGLAELMQGPSRAADDQGNVFAGLLLQVKWPLESL